MVPNSTFERQLFQVYLKAQLIQSSLFVFIFRCQDLTDIRCSLLKAAQTIADLGDAGASSPVVRISDLSTACKVYYEQAQYGFVSQSRLTH